MKMSMYKELEDLVMFKTERRKELELKEGELYWLKQEIQTLKHWCAGDSPEIGFAMLYLEKPKDGVSGFRDKLRKGEFTFTNFKSQNNKLPK